MVRLTLLTLALHGAAAAETGSGAPSETGWIDRDTPESAWYTKSHKDGEWLELVFSDEFDMDNRTFEEREDPRWSALQHMPVTNAQVNYYNSSLARTQGGVLQMLSSSEDIQYPTFQNYPTDNGPYATAHLQTPMLQSWGKFCFQGGATEIKARMPGKSTQTGLWPAFWLMGELGRATFQQSTNGLWPWTFDECVEPGTADCVATTCDAQRITACDANPGFGLNPNQGRGAPEIDIVEVQPGNFSDDYNEGCKSTAKDERPGACRDCYTPADQASRNAAYMKQPFVSTSLQLAPGYPWNADQRPWLSCLPNNEFENLPRGGSWYEDVGLTPLNVNTLAKYDVGMNYHFLGDNFSGITWARENLPKMDPVHMHTDAMSANTMLGDTHWEEFHTYRVEWTLEGDDAFMRWTLDGVLQYELTAEMVAVDRAVNISGQYVGEMRKRKMPDEPMYLILNIDSSPKWGWPSHSDYDTMICGGKCFDCKNPECSSCPGSPGASKADINKWNKERKWLAELCDALPTAIYEIDYVRVWQRPDSIAVGCDPASHPTREWIATHADDYTIPTVPLPIEKVARGGGACATAADCGVVEAAAPASGANGCVDGGCVCDEGWTGPHCRAQEPPALTAKCREIEEAANNASRTCQPHPDPTDTVGLNMLVYVLCASPNATLGPKLLAACAEIEATALHTTCLRRDTGQHNEAWAACMDFMSACTAYARASHVLQARQADAQECCFAYSWAQKPDPDQVVPPSALIQPTCRPVACEAGCMCVGDSVWLEPAAPRPPCCPSSKETKEVRGDFLLMEGFNAEGGYQVWSCEDVGPPVGLIAGAALGGAAVLAFVVWYRKEFFLCFCRKRRRFETADLGDALAPTKELSSTAGSQHALSLAEHSAPSI